MTSGSSSNSAAFADTPIDDLVAGELTWKDYINSLSPEDLEKQRHYDRIRAKKWYQENKEVRMDYMREYYAKNKARYSERHTCDICGGSFQLKTKRIHVKTQKHQEALGASNQTT